MNCKFEQLTVTPDWAGQVLERHYASIEAGHFKQRPIYPSVIASYVQEIRNGAWKVSPQCVSFDLDDNLIDGQHRLEAVRRAGLPVPMIVSTGWPVGETIRVLDQGRARSLASLLSMNGSTNATSVGATLNSICRIGFGGSAVKVSFDQATHLLSTLGIQHNIDSVLRKAANKKDFVGSVVGPLAFYHTVRPTKALSFAEDLFHYTAKPRSGVQCFLNWMKYGGQNLLGGGMQRRIAGLCSCIRAWDANVEIGRVHASNESITWLANLNPVLRDWIREHICCTGMATTNKIMSKAEK